MSCMIIGNIWGSFILNYLLLIQDLSTISTISGSRNRTISTISGSRNLLVHFYDFWIQKPQKYCRFWIQKSQHFYNIWIQKYFGPFSRFLDPEIAVFLKFLDPETAPFLQFLDCHSITHNIAAQFIHRFTYVVTFIFLAVEVGCVQVLRQQVFPDFGSPPPPRISIVSPSLDPPPLFADVILVQKVGCLMT